MNVPCSSTPARPPHSAAAVLRRRLLPIGEHRLSQQISISRLNHTAHSLAVYASWDGLLRRHARLASGWLANLSGRVWLPAGSLERFQIISSSSPRLHLAHPNPDTKYDVSICGRLTGKREEVCDLPAETQIALLRVLQEREIERVGSNQPVSVDVRLLAATNRDVGAAVATGSFREDLFYRLNVVPIVVPPLRDRVTDIPLLVEYFVVRYAKKAGKKLQQIDSSILELFKSYSWPGNIRELQNVIERGVILSEGNRFTVDESWFKRTHPKSANVPDTLPALAEREIEMIKTALVECHGRISGPMGAAAMLNVPRQTLESKIRRLGIRKYIPRPAK